MTYFFFAAKEDEIVFDKDRNAYSVYFVHLNQGYFADVARVERITKKGITLAPEVMIFPARRRSSQKLGVNTKKEAYVAYPAEVSETALRNAVAEFRK